MKHKILIILQICWTITPIWAAFKDFVIQSEKDLQRFGTSQEENYYEDDADVEFYSQYANGYDLVDDSCGSYDGYADDVMTEPNMEFNYDINMKGYEGLIDARMLKEFINILARDPRFLSLQPSEDYSLLDYERNFPADLADTPTNYEKYYEKDDQNYDDEDF